MKRSLLTTLSLCVFLSPLLSAFAAPTEFFCEEYLDRKATGRTLRLSTNGEGEFPVLSWEIHNEKGELMAEGGPWPQIEAPDLKMEGELEASWGVEVIRGRYSRIDIRSVEAAEGVMAFSVNVILREIVERDGKKSLRNRHEIMDFVLCESVE